MTWDRHVQVAGGRKGSNKSRWLSHVSTRVSTEHRGIVVWGVGSAHGGVGARRAAVQAARTYRALISAVSTPRPRTRDDSLTLMRSIRITRLVRGQRHSR